MQRVLIIGWDGATFDLIKPWIEEGKLPNIARLIKTGAHGLLRSTLPPMTFPAWSSFMTGVNPAKHGIYDFTRQRRGSYELEFVNGGQRRAPTFWNILSNAGKKVISISVPCTFPPEKVNGIMVSGFDAPGLGGKGAKVDARGIYPAELCEELDREIGGHPIGTFPMQEINQGRPDLAIERILEAIRAKAATCKYLMTRKSWDCCMILFGESDGVGHHFWRYCDPKSPLFSKEPAGQEDSIYRVYEELDKQIAEITKLMPKNTTVLMMSDHGFGGVSDQVIYPNCWLHDQGFLSFKGSNSMRMSRLLDNLKLRAVSFLPAKIKRALYRLSNRSLGSLEARVRYGMIDWNKTVAYFEENPYYPVLWINRQGRQPNGTVAPGAEYDRVCAELIKQLEEWRHPETGEKIVEKAYHRDEIYNGPAIDDAPDIIVKWAEHKGYTYAFKLSSKSEDLKWIRRVDPNQPENLQFFTGKSGSHRDDGIFIANGPGIQPGTTVEGARIIDLAPTILELLNVPVPDHVDGSPLDTILDASRSREPVMAAAAAFLYPSAAGSNDDNGEYSQEDEAKISERLRALGYID